MKRGQTTKRATPEAVLLERKMVTRSNALRLDRGKCVGCELCTSVCPQVAITHQAGVLTDGHLSKRPTIDIDPVKCNFCGECVVVCPVHALMMQVNGQTQIPVIEYEAFPSLITEIKTNASKLPAELAQPVTEICPTDVITVQLSPNGDGHLGSVQAIQIDESDCIYCKQCEALCPDAFEATHPFEGLIRLERSLCPAGCQACADICPSHSLVMRDGELMLDERFCLYCGACLKVCPAPDALTVRRHRVRHTPIKSGAWIAAVEKLISTEMASQELEMKSQAKRRSVLKFVPGIKRD
jgi:4Fe-4S ferredoxin